MTRSLHFSAGPVRIGKIEMTTNWSRGTELAPLDRPPRHILSIPEKIAEWDETYIGFLSLFNCVVTGNRNPYIGAIECRSLGELSGWKRPDQ